MSPPTWEDTPHLGAGSRYGPTPQPTARRTSCRQPQHQAPREQQWPPTPDPGNPPTAQPPISSPAPLDPTGSSTSALARLPEVLTAREAAAILRVGRNQLYQAVARGELTAVRIGRSIRIPKQALVDLLTSASPPATSDE